MVIADSRVSNCNALQRTATHCNTLQHTATHCNNMVIACPYILQTHTYGAHPMYFILMSRARKHKYLRARCLLVGQQYMNLYFKFKHQQYLKTHMHISRWGSIFLCGVGYTECGYQEYLKKYVHTYMHISRWGLMY